MRRQAKGYSTVLSWLAVLVMMVIGMAASAQAQSTTRLAACQPVALRAMEYRIDNSLTPPGGKWQPGVVPIGWEYPQLDHRATPKPAVWVRFRLQLPPQGCGQLAITLHDNQDQLLALVNGHEVFRNYRDKYDRVLSGNTPYFFLIPENIIHNGGGELLIRISGEYDVTLGHIYIGKEEDIFSIFQRLYFWNATFLTIANVVTGVLALLAILIWFARRREVDLLYIFFVGVFCVIQNNIHFGSVMIFDVHTFEAIANYIVYLNICTIVSYCITTLRIPNSRKISIGIYSIGTCLFAVRMYFGLGHLVESITYIVGICVILTVDIIVIIDYFRRPSRTHYIFLATLLLVDLGFLHDFGRQWFIGWWSGLGFYTLPFDGFMFCLVFMLLLGVRARNAFNALESVNETLASRVDDARRQLAISETRRRELEVASAVESERQRIMREVHDGIGANIAAALAVARRQNHPASSVNTLRRALADLKITVDSLERFGGDVPALLGNFRMRMASDLAEAGIACDWDAAQCPPVSWLDAPNALHLLRIFQEALSNVVTHSGADRIALGCRLYRGADGDYLEAYLSDNGCGFDGQAPSATGHGRANMAERARAIGAGFACDSTPGSGTTITVRLPYGRDEVVA